MKNKWVVGFCIFCIVGFVLVGCDTTTNGGGNNTTKYPKGSGIGNAEDVKKMYDELKAKKPSPSYLSISGPDRSVINLDAISKDYKMAVVSVYDVDGYDTADHNHISERDWTDVSEGVIKLDYHGLNGDGVEIWVFVSIQNGEPYVIFANDTLAERFPVGVTPDTSRSNVWFYRWS